MSEAPAPRGTFDVLAADVGADRQTALHALHVLEYALAAPAPRRHRTWLHRVTVAVDALHAALHAQLPTADGPIRLLDEIALCHPSYISRIRADPAGTARPHDRRRVPARTDRARPDHRDRPRRYQRPARRRGRTIPGAPSPRSRPRLRGHRPRTRRTLNITVSLRLPTPRSGPVGCACEGLRWYVTSKSRQRNS